MSFKSVKEVAQITGKHENTIYQMIEDGRLKAIKNKHGKYEIPYGSVHPLKEEKECKEDIKTFKSSIEKIKSEIEEDILYKSHYLFLAFEDMINKFKKSSEYEELSKIEMELFELKDKMILFSKEEEEEFFNKLVRKHELYFELDSKKRDMLLELKDKIQDFLDINKLNDDICQFGKETKFRKEKKYQTVKEFGEIFVKGGK